MTFLLTGATGFIGSRLVRQLVDSGHTVHYLARRRDPRFDSQVAFHLWDSNKEAAPLNSVPRMDVIIHLAGEPVAQRWTPEVKQRILDSRVQGTRKLVVALAELRHRPTTLITASAIGYYGNRGDEVLTEQSAPGNNFLAKVCVAWQAEAMKAADLGLRVVPIRFATVLGKENGAFPKLLAPARLGLGATFGNGQQWMSWIHIKDLIDMIIYTSTTLSVDHALNGAAPEPVTNANFTKALGSVLHRPAFLSVPKFALRTALGEMAEFLFDSLRVVPEAVIRSGFQYRFANLRTALTDLTT